MALYSLLCFQLVSLEERSGRIAFAIFFLKNEEELNQALDYFLRRNPINLLGTKSEGSRRGSEGESEWRRRGRPTTEVATCAENGRRLCDHLCFALQRKKLTRPVGRTYGKRDRHNRAIE